MREDWIEIELEEVAKVNPKKPQADDELEVTFLPMPLVEEETGRYHLKETRKFSQVKKGYTGFIEGDVLFAKITPCMENGKIAAINDLINSVGFGSTEFHVLRPSFAIEKKYLFYYLVQKAFRGYAQRKMTGSAGQLRVPKSVLESAKIPLAPLPEQRAIVAKIEQLFSELDNGIANLKAAKDKLEIYRQAVLKKAFEGDWQITSVGDKFDFLGGGTPSKSNPKYWNGDIPWCSVKDVKGDFLTKTKDYITELGVDESATNIAEVGQVILITRISPGKSIIPKIRTAINQDLKIIFPKLDYRSKFTHYLFKSLERECVKRSSGTTVLGINLNSLKEIEIPDVPVEEQETIIEFIESRLSVCDNILANIEEGLEKSEALRQSILKQAFEGKLLSEEELEACRKEPDWEPAEELLERVRNQKEVTA